MAGGIAQAATTQRGEVVSVAVSGWGVDFGLLDRAGSLLELPYSYRDERTVSTPERVFRRLDELAWYRATGVATMPINTLFQLAWAIDHRPEVFDRATHALLIPDLIAHSLSGEPVTERTIASTTQMLDITDATWRRKDLVGLGIPDEILDDPVPAGTVVAGPGSPIAREIGRPLSVVAAASHDTAAAFVASAAGDDEAVLSCGTWALLGVQGPTAHTGGDAFDAGLTNERCADERIRTLRNLTGLWILQECMRAWSAKSDDLDYATLDAEASEARPFAAVVDTSDSRFTTPGDMVSKIRQFCHDTRQPAPDTRGGLSRTVLEGLALQFRRTLRTLEQVTGTEIAGIRVVGGGIHQRLLNQLTADATGVPVATGQAEATALGNALVQMVAAGELSDLGEAHQLVTRMATRTYHPVDDPRWEEADHQLEAVTA